jgi:hypothetical protein
MEWHQNEFNSNAVNARPCYSNMEKYGAHGKINPIVPPSAATIVPQMFNIIKPHTIKQDKLPSQNTLNNSNPNSKLKNWCYPYRTFSNICYNNVV